MVLLGNVTRQFSAWTRTNLGISCQIMRRLNVSHLPSVTFALLVLLEPIRASLTVPDNVAVVERSAKSAADSLLAHFIPGDSLCLSVVGAPGSWLVEMAILREASARRILVLSSSNCSYGVSEAHIAAKKIAVRFSPIDDSDSLVRSAEISIAGAIGLVGAARVRWGEGGDDDSRAQIVVDYQTTHVDTIARQDSSTVSGPPPFNSTIPPRPTSGFWVRIIEPAIVIGATVVATVLLFTVRSK